MTFPRKQKGRVTALSVFPMVSPLTLVVKRRTRVQRQNLAKVLEDELRLRIRRGVEERQNCPVLRL